MQTYIINLTHRPERLERTINEIKKVGITNYKVIPAFNINNWGVKPEKSLTHTWSSLGCTLSHWFAIKSGIMDGEEEVLIFEDDVLIPEDINIEKLKSEAPKDWDVLFYGWQIYDGKVDVWQDYKPTDKWGKVANSYGSHFVLCRNLKQIDKLFENSRMTHQIDDEFRMWDIEGELNMYYLRKGQAKQYGHTIETKKDWSTDIQTNFKPKFD